MLLISSSRLVNYSWISTTDLNWHNGIKNTTRNDRYVHIFKNEQNLLRSVICSGGRTYCIKLNFKIYMQFLHRFEKQFELWIHHIFIFRSAAVCIDKFTCLKYHFKRSSELFKHMYTFWGKYWHALKKLWVFWVHITSIISFTLYLKIKLISTIFMKFFNDFITTERSFGKA